jgi:hypothetical protein
MEPITKSLKKRKFKQCEKEEQSFALIKKKKRIKKKVCNALVLALLNFDKLFENEYDACGVSIEKVLS